MFSFFILFIGWSYYKYIIENGEKKIIIKINLFFNGGKNRYIFMNELKNVIIK